MRGERYALFDSYPICAFSGGPGPKLAEGDGQSPEGFYEVGRRQLNPDSAYHLAFDLGFPNALDRMLGRTGSYLMVHGSCVSIGCYAMTDHGITEIYGLVAAALEAGQPGVPVHVFPFRMTPSAMAAAADSTWAAFWAKPRKATTRSRRRMCHPASPPARDATPSARQAPAARASPRGSHAGRAALALTPRQ